MAFRNNVILQRYFIHYSYATTIKIMNFETSSYIHNFSNTFLEQTVYGTIFYICYRSFLQHSTNIHQLKIEARIFLCVYDRI